jgi:hypothetical protein
MQHDLYPNPNPRSRRAYPLIIVLQADMAEGDTRLIAPLAPMVGPLASGASRGLPRVDHENKPYVVTLPLISSLPESAEACDRIAGALPR